MNLLLVERDELTCTETSPHGELVLSDDRARHLREVLRVSPGRRVRVGVIDGGVGEAEVLFVEGERVALRALGFSAAPPVPRVDLVLAIPRPKVLKRLWAPLASLGVGRVMLTNASRVERFYFDSHAVRPETYRPRLVEGLAQARDTRLPSVEVHKSLKILVEDELDARCPDARRLLADPAYDRSAYDAAHGTAKERSIVLALGPEGGWNDFERDLLERHGFVGVGLGRRVLRSDIAALALLAIVHEAIGG